MSIKELLKRNPFVEAHLRKKRLTRWMANGFPDPIPHEAKQLAILYYGLAYKLDTFIETGTFKGDMVWAQKDFFRQLYSIELSKELFEQARTRFRNFDHVHLLHGDSSDKIVDALSQTSSSALIFLDGHYSGGVTAMGVSECPIFAELNHIFASPHRHFVLIDDARLFVGKNDYPTLDELANYVSSNSKYNMRTESDFIILSIPN